MTSKEAYLSDLDDLEKEIERLLSLVPVGKTKKELQGREQAEEAASVIVDQDGRLLLEDVYNGFDDLLEAGWAVVDGE